MIQSYTITQLSKEDKMTEAGIAYRIKKKLHYIPVRVDGATFAKNKKWFTVRYIKMSDLKVYLLSH